MKTFIELENTKSKELPPQFANVDDVRYTSEFVEVFLKGYSKEGDIVFDPFAGFGTTLQVAEKMNRVPCGIEYDKQRADYIRSLLNNKDGIIHGDTQKLSSYELPKFDISLTSPPYMSKGDKENPFTSYQEAGNGYEAYLKDIANIYRQVAELANDKAKVIIEISNVKQADEVTTLAWDVCGAVSTHLHFDGEIVIGWKPTYGHGYDHSYCLVFSKIQ